jgi:hypothetical protein
MPDRRFPPPWTVEEHNDACFIVKGQTPSIAGPLDCTALTIGQRDSLAGVYLEGTKNRRATTRTTPWAP